MPRLLSSCWYNLKAKIAKSSSCTFTCNALTLHLPFIIIKRDEKGNKSEKIDKYSNEIADAMENVRKHSWIPLWNSKLQQNLLSPTHKHPTTPTRVRWQWNNEYESTCFVKRREY